MSNEKNKKTFSFINDTYPNTQRDCSGNFTALITASISCGSMIKLSAKTNETIKHRANHKWTPSVLPDEMSERNHSTVDLFAERIQEKLSSVTLSEHYKPLMKISTTVNPLILNYLTTSASTNSANSGR
jgi:hypothetical protein